MKSQPWSQIVTSCGVVNNFTRTHLDGEVSTSMKPSSREKLISILSRAQADDYLPPHLAASIGPKLRWVAIGPVGRAATQPIRVRQYEQEENEIGLPWRISSSVALRTSVEFILKLLTGPLPEVVFKGIGSGLPPILIWSDASWHPLPGSAVGAGRVAFVAFITRPGESPPGWCLRSRKYLPRFSCVLSPSGPSRILSLLLRRLLLRRLIFALRFWMIFAAAT